MSSASGSSQGMRATSAISGSGHGGAASSGTSHGGGASSRSSHAGGASSQDVDQQAQASEGGPQQPRHETAVRPRPSKNRSRDPVREWNRAKKKASASTSEDGEASTGAGGGGQYASLMDSEVNTMQEMWGEWYGGRDGRRPLRDYYEEAKGNGKRGGWTVLFQSAKGRQAYLRERQKWKETRGPPFEAIAHLARKEIEDLYLLKQPEARVVNAVTTLNSYQHMMGQDEEPMPIRTFVKHLASLKKNYGQIEHSVRSWTPTNRTARQG